MGVGLGWKGNVKGQCHCKKTIKEVLIRKIILTLGENIENNYIHEVLPEMNFVRVIATYLISVMCRIQVKLWLQISDLAILM